MSDDLVGRDCLDQLDLIVGLEISHLVLDLTDNLEVVAAEHELDVDVDRDGNFPDCIFHEKDHASRQCSLKVDTTAVLNEECNLTLVICTFQVNMASDKLSTTAACIIF